MELYCIINLINLSIIIYQVIGNEGHRCAWGALRDTLFSSAAGYAVLIIMPCNASIHAMYFINELRHSNFFNECILLGNLITNIFSKSFKKLLLILKMLKFLLKNMQPQVDHKI